MCPVTPRDGANTTPAPEPSQCVHTPRPDGSGGGMARQTAAKRSDHRSLAEENPPTTSEPGNVTRPITFGVESPAIKKA